MKVTRKSIISGVVRTLDLAITPEQVAAYNAGTLVQNAFPTLDKKEREFYKTGVTGEEWDALFPPTDEDEGKKEG